MGNKFNLDLSPSTPGSTLPSGDIVCSGTNRSTIIRQKMMVGQYNTRGTAYNRTRDDTGT